MFEESEFHDSRDALYKKLKKFIGKNIILLLSSCDTIEEELIRVHNAIVKTRELVMVSPFEEK